MTISQPPTPPPKRRGRPPIVRDFFDAALTEAEQDMMPSARAMEGLDEEIALLRTKLRTLAERKKPKPVHYQLLVRGMDTLARLLAVRYRLSKKSQADLADSIAAVLSSARTELGLGDDSVA